MSTAILLPQNGFLIAILNKGQTTPGLLTVNGLDHTTTGVLITAFSQGAQVAHQITQTVGGPEYLFVFGDMLQDLNIGIVVYPKGCDDSAGASSYLKAWQFYDSNRLKPGAVTPVTLNFAGLALSGLVVAFKVDSDATQGTQVIRGTLVLKGWAVTSANGTSNAGGSNAAGTSASGGAAAGAPPGNDGLATVGGAVTTAADAAAQQASGGLSQPGGFFTPTAEQRKASGL